MDNSQLRFDLDACRENQFAMKLSISNSMYINKNTGHTPGMLVRESFRTITSAPSFTMLAASKTGSLSVTAYRKMAIDSKQGGTRGRYNTDTAQTRPRICSNIPLEPAVQHLSFNVPAIFSADFHRYRNPLRCLNTMHRLSASVSKSENGSLVITHISVLVRSCALQRCPSASDRTWSQPYWAWVQTSTACSCRSWTGGGQCDESLGTQST